MGVPTGSSPKLKLVLPKLSTGFELIPVPLTATVAVPPLAQLLEMLSVPLAVPVTVGLKLTCMVSDCPGFRVAGNVIPDIVKPVPERVAELIVTAAVPVEVKVRVFIEVEFRFTVPKDRLLALTPS
jgi:hypothetical protein